MPHTRGLADAFDDSVNGRSGAVAGIAAALWNREDESAPLSPLPDRREVFAAKGPKDDFGSCIFEHDFEPRGVLDPITRNQARLIVDVDLAASPSLVRSASASGCKSSRSNWFAWSFFILAPSPAGCPSTRSCHLTPVPRVSDKGAARKNVPAAG